MSVIVIPKEIDKFVLYFDTPRKEINAIALATALVGLADSVREANTLINPGYNVEVVVEALEGGSFQAVVRTIYNCGKDIFSSEPVKAIVYGVIASYIYQHTLAPDTQTIVNVEDDRVVIQSGEDRVIVPKEVFEAKERLEKSERFKAAVSSTINAATSDPEVRGVGLKTDPEEKNLPYLFHERNSQYSKLGEKTKKILGKSSNMRTWKFLARFFHVAIGSGNFSGVV